MKKSILLIISLTVFSFGICLTACADSKQEQTSVTDDAKPEVEAQAAQIEAESGNIKAADFALEDLSGNTMKLSDYRGKVVIVDFWATWCPPCVKEIPHFNDLQKEYSEKGLVVLGVSVDRQGAQVVHDFKKKSPIDYRVAMYDQQTYDTYQAYLPVDERGGIPFTFVIDREGNIREHYVGYRPKEVFVKVVEPLL